MTTPTKTSSKHESVGLYALAWAAQEPADIRAALTSCWDPQGRYVDPITNPVTGVEAMVEHLVAFGRQFPGATLTSTGDLQLHHDVGRFGWVMAAPSPIVLGGVDYGRRVTGFDVVEFAVDHRMTRVIGFFDGGARSTVGSPAATPAGAGSS